MIGRRGIAVISWLVAAPTLSRAAWSQATPPQATPPQSCADVLTAPTRDSVLLRVLLTVHAFDRERDLPSPMQLDFGDAVRRRLALPRPLGVDAYETAGDSSTARTARLTLRGMYAATLTAEGRVVEVSTTGGARNSAFDAAVIAAMSAIDSTDQLSPALAGLPKDDMRIRVEIAARDTTAKPGSGVLESVMISAMSSATRNPDAPPSFAPLPPDSGMAIPLFGFRVPVRAVTGRLAQIPGFGALRYPQSQRKPGNRGQSQLSFVVDTDGMAEPASVQVVNATQREFAEAALNATPKFRFRPLEVNGCKVRAYAEIPFYFYVAR